MMVRRATMVLVAALVLAGLVACGPNKRVSNPIADVGSKQPDKVLFDRAMDMMKRNKFDEARLTLQTLINTYPDSEFIARAKLAVGDSWYAEHTTAALAQAEAEYKDFKTFFPNMPEAAEAQMKVGDIHYQQMEKPDRDFTHAKRADEEYRALLIEYPDHPLADKVKQRLREVQEVLAEREFRIGRFYYLRGSYPAAIARLKSVTDTYELYSGAEDALYMIGSSFEKQLELTRATPGIPEDRKGKLIAEFTKGASDAYSRIISRYPVTGRVADAKARLQALNQPVPTPTEAAIAQNKAEESSRQQLGFWASKMLNFRKRPDVAQASKVGDPTLAPPAPISAAALAKRTRDTMTGTSDSPSGSVSVERVGTDAPPENQPVPRAEGQVDTTPSDIPELTPLETAPGTTNQINTPPPQANPAASGPTPDQAAVETPQPAPQQTNEAPAVTNDAGSEAQPVDKQQESSSKKKAKKKKQ